MVISPSNPQHLNACNAALAAEGLEERFPIFNFGRVPPLLDEPPEPFPLLSHMTPDEVTAARGRLKDVDWARYGPHVEQTIRMIDEWVEHAAGRRQGSVRVYG